MSTRGTFMEDGYGRRRRTGGRVVPMTDGEEGQLMGKYPDAHEYRLQGLGICLPMSFAELTTCKSAQRDLCIFAVFVRVSSGGHCWAGIYLKRGWISPCLT